MKKYQIALAVIAMTVLASCQKEKDFDRIVVGENEIAFVLQSRGATRAADEPMVSGKEVIPVTVKGQEHPVYLEMEVVELNEVGPATRGTPAYTENLGKLYKKDLGVYSDVASFGDAAYEGMDDQMVAGGWRYHHNYDGNPWPDKTTPVDFWLRMPANAEGVTNMLHGKDGDERHTSFHYVTPENASSQPDLIFGAISINKQTHDDALPEGAKVYFQHALTGVKFQIVNNDVLENGKDGRIQTYITNVTINNLKNAGSGFVTTDATPSATEHEDFPEDAYVRSGAYGSVLWVYEDGTDSFSQSYNESDLVNYASGEGSFANNGGYPESFSAAGNKNNLNDTDATLTFWFIPQTLTEDVTMDVTFHVWDGMKNQESKTLTVNLGELAIERGELISKWEAGQIRTFSLKPNTVDVDIKDDMNEYVKSNVTIQNTGNTAEYVRVNIIGNWIGNVWEGTDENDKPIYSSINTVMNGYAAETGVTPVAWSDRNGRVLAWNDKDPEEANKIYHYGVFDGLPAKTNTSAIDVETMKAADGYWVRLDKYYYYTKPIGPGQFVPSTTPVFNNYTLLEENIPTFWIPDRWGGRKAAGNVHLEMDLAVQAIEAPLDEDGNEASDFMTVWANALGKEVADLNDL